MGSISTRAAKSSSASRCARDFVGAEILIESGVKQRLRFRLGRSSPPAGGAPRKSRAATAGARCRAPSRRPGSSCLISADQTSSSTSSDCRSRSHSLVAAALLLRRRVLTSIGSRSASSAVIASSGRWPQVWKMTASKSFCASQANCSASMDLPVPGSPCSRNTVGSQVSALRNRSR